MKMIFQYWDNSMKLCLNCTKCTDDEHMAVLTPCTLFSDTICKEKKDDDFFDKAFDKKVSLIETISGKANINY